MVLADYSDSTDDELVAAARAGSSEAWEELARRYYPPLLRFLTAQTGDPQDAADLTQQTFLDAFRRLDRLQPGQPFMPWLYQIARYNFLPFWRRRWGLRHASLEALMEQAGEAVTALRQPDETVAVEEREAIRQAVDELSPLLREALLLHELKGLHAPKIAALLGISESAAEQRISRAADQFRLRYNALSGQTKR